MSTPRSTVPIVNYLHKNPSRGRSNSIVQIPVSDGAVQTYETYVRDYSVVVGAGSFGEVCRLRHEKDSTKTILAKIEKKNANGHYIEGYTMLREAENWVKIKGTGGYAGDPSKTQDAHVIIMPDLATKTTLRLKELRYDSAASFLKIVHLILDKLYDFHYEKQMVHYDLSDKNIIYDFSKKQIEFVDPSFSRNIGEKIDELLCREHAHSGTNSGYFPPELNPKLIALDKSAKLDDTAQPSHDVYMLGRMLSHLINQAADPSGKAIEFLPCIKAEFEKICSAMHAKDASTRIALDDALYKVVTLIQLNELLEKQDGLSEKNNANLKMAKKLLQTLNNDLDEVLHFARFFNPKNQAAFLNLFEIKNIEPEKSPPQEVTNHNAPSLQ